MTVTYLSQPSGVQKRINYVIDIFPLANGDLYLLENQGHRNTPQNGIRIELKNLLKISDNDNLM